MVSVAEFLAFCEHFELCPSIISRSMIQKTIFYNSLPPELESFKESKAKGLNYTSFLEAIARMAMYIYSKYPYTDMVKNPREKIELLFEHLGFKDVTKYRNYLKRSGLGLAQSRLSPVKNKVVPQRKDLSEVTNENASYVSSEARKQYLELLQNKNALKDDLEAIFMFYCSYGNRLNLDLMSSSKFKMFIRDTNIYDYGFKQEEVDLIFIKCITPASKKGTSNSKMSFPQFIDCLKDIATKLRKSLPANKAFAQFLLLDVLPNVHRLSSKSTDYEDYKSEQIQQLFEMHRKNLYKVCSKFDDLTFHI